VIAQLEVRDNHAPTPQTGRSSSVILRLPSAEVALGAELEGRIKKTLPAYFRSQRQIIIDAEALIRQRRSLAAEDFVKRSDAIGVDQRILRLRYGQFLGEESEGAPKPPPTSDLPTSDTPTADGHDDDHDHDHGAEAGAHDAWPRSRRQQPTPIRRRCSAAPPTCFPNTATPMTTPRRHPARPADPRHAEGRAGPDVVGRRRAAPGPPGAGAAVCLQGAGLHQAGAAGRAHLPGPGRAGAATDR
jgi:hypothetical protein